MCIVCGLPVNEKLFGYKDEGLMLKNEEIERVNKLGIKKLLRRNKLYLVMDLDHALLYSTDLNQMTAGESTCRARYIQSGRYEYDDQVKAFCEDILKEANEMYEMYLYTTGELAYTLEMAKLLDPRKEYFGDRVISHNDGTKEHGLDVVHGQDSAFLILDDTRNGWTKHSENLLLVKRY